jgi:transposase
MTQTFSNFIGIDVAKNKVDVFCLTTSVHRAIENNSQALQTFFGKMETKNTLVVLENTGGYENTCLSTLLDMGFALHRTNNNKVHGFVHSLGKKAKNDRIDAKTLALYGERDWQKENLKLWQKKDELEEKIRQLAAYLSELRATRAREKNRVQSPGCVLIRDSVKETLRLMDQNIQNVEKELDDLIDSHPDFKNRLELACGYKCIGKKTAIQLLAHLPELGKVNRQAIAALSGTAPYDRDSGQKRGYRSTRYGGRPIVKCVLYMASLSATRYNKKIADYYQRRIKTEKAKMKIVVAVMRKIIVQLNAILKVGYIREENV